MKSQMSQSQRDVDTTVTECAATMQGRHEQQLISLEKSQGTLGQTLEKGQEILRQDVGELRKDIRDLVTVLTVSINDKHKANMDYFGKIDDRMDGMAVDAAEIKTTVANHDKDIEFIKNVIYGSAVALGSGTIGALCWFVQKSIGGQ